MLRAQQLIDELIEGGKWDPENEVHDIIDKFGGKSVGMDRTNVWYVFDMKSLPNALKAAEEIKILGFSAETKNSHLWVKTR